MSASLPAAGRSAGINYLDKATPSSLYRTGALRMLRDAAGSDSELVGVEFSREVVSLDDGRGYGEGQGCKLDGQGFEVLDAPTADASLDFLSMEAVVDRYYAECCEIVQQSTGAREVHAFDHNVRSIAGKNAREQIRNGQGVQGPARVVHGDYALTSAPQRLRDLGQAPALNDTYSRILGSRESLLDPDQVESAIASGRFAFINLWRNIDTAPVQSDPLVLCDAQTVEPEDLCVFEIHYADRVGENYWAKPASRHSWFIYPEIERSEAMLIKQWDNAGAIARSEGREGDALAPDSPCTFSFHTAYYDPTTMDGKPPRWSVEVRCVVFY